MQVNIVTIVCILTISLGVGCQRTQEPISNESNIDEIPDQESWNASLTTSAKGILISRINYTHMQKFSKRQKIHFLDGVEIELFDAKGAPTSTVLADEAAFKDGQRDLTMIGNVRARSQDGFQLRTEKLNWNDFKETISSDEFVTVITAEGDTINGTGFESDKLFNNWTIKKPWGVTQGKLNLGPKP